MADPALTVAVIGSFRNHYHVALEAVEMFRREGLTVTSPAGTPIVEPGIDFVRFESDPTDWDDPTVQTVALHRILRAHVVYVAAPGGYVGRTTCYEIGRVIQANRPIYFSEQPRDLPLAVPPSHIKSAADLVALVRSGELPPIFGNEPGDYAALERRLIDGNFISD